MKKEKITLKQALKYFSYNPETGVFIKKKNKKVAGYFDKFGYVILLYKNKPIKAHRLAFLVMTGTWPIAEVDHINGGKADNRWANLRDVSHNENRKNLKLYKNSKSGFRGIAWCTENKKYYVYINDNGRRLFLGRYSSFDDAVNVRIEAERNLSYHINHGRLSIAKE